MSKVIPRWVPEQIGRGIDSQAGARIVQLTSAALISHNIYNEQHYTSRDGSRLAFNRCPSCDVNRDPSELWVSDFNLRYTAQVDSGVHVAVASNAFSDDIFYVRNHPGGTPRVTRLNLMTLEKEDLFAFGACPLPEAGTATVSPDGRYFVSGMRIKGRRYGLYRIDLAQAKWDVFHEHDDILNPHVQYEPGAGRDLLVQLNRGGEIDAHGNIIRLVGEEGATLYLIDSEGGNVRPLPVGKPHTAGVTGHECWIGKTGRVLLTLEDAAGSLCSVAGGDTRCQPLAKGLNLMHVNASPCGRFFIADDMQSGLLHVGSFKTGKTRALCDSKASGGSPQYTHAHPYLTPDLRRAIFNSDRTGIGQVFAAEIPSGFLEQLELV